MIDAEQGRMKPAAIAIRAAVCLLVAVALAWLWSTRVVHVRPSAFEVAPRALAASSHDGSDRPSLFAARFLPDPVTPEVHASAAFAGPDGGVTTFWYGGTAEGSADVAIYATRLADGQWGPARVVVERERAAAQLGRPLRKLGNISVHRHADGRLWLFFVSVSFGGWAGSALNLLESTDDGATWSPARRLVASPFLNLSTLARGSALTHVDGSISLPVYHEFVGKFSELLRIAPDGRILSKSRLSSGREALQPEVVVIAADRAVALMRAAGAPYRVLLASSEDAGRTWSAAVATGMANPDAALDALLIDGGRLLAVLNDTERDRERLVLVTTEGMPRDWRTVALLEDRPPAAAIGPHEFSYPWLLRDSAGIYHVFYTWNRRRIKHVAFDQRWLDQADEEASRAVAAPDDAAGTTRR